MIVPAHDEAALIGDCLRSVAHAADAVRGRARVSVVVVADSCTDATVARARAALGPPSGAVVEVNVRNVGSSRATGADLLLSAWRGVEPASCWLASTDADTVVPDHWLSRHLDLADRGHAGVAGVVRVGSFAEHGPEVPARFAATYELRADGTHPHVHGANLGVRADAYLDAGGWPALPLHEDHGLWDRLAERAWPLASSTASWVTTSGRRRGRAVGGFAEALAAHDNAVPGGTVGPSAAAS